LNPSGGVQGNLQSFRIERVIAVVVVGGVHNLNPREQLLRFLELNGTQDEHGEAGCRYSSSCAWVRALPEVWDDLIPFDELDHMKGEA
jgi:hypothetical protein